GVARHPADGLLGGDAVGDRFVGCGDGVDQGVNVWRVGRAGGVSPRAAGGAERGGRGQGGDFGGGDGPVAHHRVRRGVLGGFQRIGIMMTSGDIPAIEVGGLACGYGDTVLLDGLNFSVRRGEIFFIIGGSGCGKSTLLRHLVGLHAPMAGEVKYFGESFTGADAGRQREFLQTFGVLYQGGALWSSLTLRENVALPLIEYTTLTPSERDEI